MASFNINATIKVGVDWDNDGFINWGALTGDALNIIPTPITLHDIDIVRGSGQAIVNKINALTDQGNRQYSCQTSTDLFGGMIIGQDGITTDDIPVDASTEYTVAIWMKGVSDFASVPIRIIIRDQVSTNIEVGVDFNLTSDFIKYEVTFTTPVGTTFIQILINKNNDATDMDFLATGLFLAEGASLPVGFNAGVTSNLNDNLRPYLTSSTWMIGSQSRENAVADEPAADIMVTNEDGRFSPEESSGPNFGDLNPNRQMEIRLTNLSSVTSTYWRGFTEKIAPAWGKNLHGKTSITGRGLKRLADGIETHIALQTDVTADELIPDLFYAANAVPPAPTVGYWVLGITGRSELDQNTYLISNSDLFNLDIGIEVFPFVGDNWINDISLNSGLQSLADSERGRIFQARSGKITFWNKQFLQLNITASGTINDTMQSMNYAYGEDIINDVIVTVYPRTISGTVETLWSLQGAIVLEPGDSQTLTANLIDTQGGIVSALSVAFPSVAENTLVFSGGLLNISGFNVSARQVSMLLSNPAEVGPHNEHPTTTTISSLALKGRKITTFDVEEIQAIDADSGFEFGPHQKSIDLKLVSSRDIANDIATFELNNFKNPVGVLSSITLKNKDADTLTTMLDSPVGTVLLITETRTGHSAEHIVIGEKHTINTGEKLHVTELFLMPALFTASWILGTTGFSELGITTKLGL